MSDAGTLFSADDYITRGPSEAERAASDLRYRYGPEKAARDLRGRWNADGTPRAPASAPSSGTTAASSGGRASNSFVKPGNGFQNISRSQPWKTRAANTAKGAGRGTAIAMGSHLAANFLGENTGNDAFTESAETALRVGGLVGAYNPVAGVVAGGVVGAGDFATRMLGQPLGLSAAFDSKGQGFSQANNDRLTKQMDTFDISPEQRTEIYAEVNAYAAENGYGDEGAEAVDVGFDLIMDAKDQERNFAHQLQLQEATTVLMEKIGGQRVTRAEDAFERAKTPIQGLSAEANAARLNTARNGVDRAHNISDAYLSQAALMPQYNALLQQSTDIQSVNAQLDQQELVAQMSEDRGYATSEGTQL